MTFIDLAYSALKHCFSISREGLRIDIRNKKRVKLLLKRLACFEINGDIELNSTAI
jgi:hypothetical protein